MGLSDIPWAELAPFFVIGFLAQIIDGALGMAFGVVTNTLLILLGIPPAAASSSVRAAESFAGGVSGLAHVLRGNVDWALFRRLVVMGILGGLLGAWVLSHIHLAILRPIVLAYLAALGTYLIWRAPRRPQTYRRLRFVEPLGFVGGVLDASGGGGWGPIATGSLLAQGATPRIAIGTVNAAKFFVTITVLSAFIGTLGLAGVTVVTAGLLAGSVLAAPLAAELARRVPRQALVVSAGILLIAISLYGLLALVIGPVPSFPRF